MADAPLLLDPPAAQFSAESGGQSQHALVNQTAARLAVKIKCSDNALYRVRPVFSIVEPGTALGLEVTRNPAGAVKDDRLVLQYAEVSPEEQDPQAPFRTPGTFPELRLPLSAA